MAVHDAVVAVNVTSAARADPCRDGWQVGADAAPGACAPDAGELRTRSDALDAGALAALALGLVFLFIIFARGCA